MIEPSRFAPKPRRTKASCVPPRVLVCTTLLTLYSASSSVVAFWSSSTLSLTVLTTCGMSSIGMLVSVAVEVFRG
ncbi:Uncharacterised protein [Enterobacter cloacae]|nr:Uncharacterised protein [Enterobacter cloacae]